MEGEWIQGGCIGKGSFGTVRLAYDKSDGGRVFAVKSVPLHPSASASSKNSIASIENEIEILRSLESSYIVSYLGDSTTRGWRNLHMEYVPGGTLADVAGTLDETEVRAYARRVVQALLYLHTVAGVVHSDVKGRNVLAGPSPGLAKLADFGSARRISDDNSRPTLIGGTPLWMAPEVIRGAQPKPESDIWSLGCTVIEMITGSHPWKKNSSQDKLNWFQISVGNQLPEFPSKLSKLGRDFLDKCLRRNPEERWTAEQLLQHPFLADDAAAAAETGRGSPRSTLDWINLEFDDDDEAAAHDDEEGDVDVVGLGAERIRELAEINNNHSGGIWIDNWDSEGWEVVRYFGGETGEDRTGELEVRNWEASGSGLSNEVSSSCSCSSSCCCCDCKGEIGCQQVGEVFVFVFVLFYGNANPIFFTWVLQLYRFARLTLLLSL